MTHQQEILTLNLADLSVGYSSAKEILRGLSFEFLPGLTGIIGINGTGKSTLLKTIAGLLSPLKGSILLNGKDCSGMDVEERARNFSVVLTDRISDPYLSVFDVVATGRSPYTGFLGKPSESDNAIIQKYMRMCGIAQLDQKKCGQISDGEKQKMMIARALAQQTPVILLDEPSSFLDFRARYEILDLLRTIAHEEKKIILFSSHDVEMVFKTAMQCLVIFNREEVLLRSCKEIIASDIPQRLLKGSNLEFDKSTQSIVFKK